MTLHLASSDTSAGLYNIGSGEAHTWLSLTSALFAAMDRAPSIDFIDMPEKMRDRYQYFTQADVSRLRATGYDAPPTALSAAIADYVQGYLAHDRRLGDEA
jgi:ADP-L-glycero-D-manno-heptose 6-epimerase